MTQQEPTYDYLGKGRKIIDGLEKITGRARYTADLSLQGMLHIRPVLSIYAHARIVSIDTEAARQMPGVVAVLTAQDLQTRDKPINSRHSAVLAQDRVLFRGQPVVAVVAESEQEAQDAAEAVLIDYEPLPTVVDPELALAADAPVIWPNGLPKDGADLTAQHAAVDKETEDEDREPSNLNAENHFARGNVAEGFKQADVIVERVYRTSIVHQGYMEPHAVVAEPGPLGQSITFYTSTQGQFSVRDETARLLGLPKRQVRVVPMTIGGGFGAKYGLIEPLVGAVALALGRPMRMVLTRSEDFLTTTPAPASIIEVKTGATRDGTITAIQAKVIMDNGVFPFGVGGIVGILLGGYYVCPNVAIDCREVLTNKPQGGAYRAPGAPAATFALESNIDDMARELQIDPLEFRLKNAAVTGSAMGNGDPWPNIGLTACLERMREHPAWQKRTTGTDRTSPTGMLEGVGIAVGGWPCGMSPAGAVCRVEGDGTVRVHVGTVDISGVNSSYVLIAAEMIGVSPDQVEIVQGDTRSGPYGPASGGSQTTYSTAGAVANAALEVKKRLLDLASDHFEAAPEDLEINDGIVQVKGVPDQTITIAALAHIAEHKQGGPGPIAGDGRSAIEENAPGFVVHLAKVAVDPETGHTDVQQYVAIQDVGFALNPMLVEGQIQGGVAQGIGWGLHEAMIYDEHGQLLTSTFMDYDLPKATQIPNIDVIMVQNRSPHGPFGARGVGEPPITAGGAAIANAIRDATGARLTELPMRVESVWRALQEEVASTDTIEAA